ncbi:hypothetical protein MIR68_007889 [Amoeboaphelidium protococcarum]|nr:hypothetical protein MIR68_007889 [Amoeboaphelidium protococcarum]
MDQKAKSVQPGYTFSTVAHSGEKSLSSCYEQVANCQEYCNEIGRVTWHNHCYVQYDSSGAQTTGSVCYCSDVADSSTLKPVLSEHYDFEIMKDALRVGEDPDNFVMADYAYNISMDYTRAYFLIPRKSELYGFVSNEFMNNGTRMEVNIGAECAMESEVCTQRCNSRGEEASFTCGPRSLYVMPYFFRELNPQRPYPQVASSCVCQQSSAGLNLSTVGGTQLNDMAFGGYNNNMWLILALLCFVLAVLNIIMKYKLSRPSLPLHIVAKN